MKSLLLYLLIAFTSASAGEVFRVSRVAKAAGEGIERMIFKAGDHEEALFVEKAAVVSAADVQEAGAEILPSMRGISIRLKPEAGKKMEDVTGEMIPGVERLAVVVEGKPVFAPVVQAKLGAGIWIEGFDDLTDEQLKELARKIARRPPGEPQEEMPELKRPEEKREPYTEEEYQQIKARREKIGIFHLDKVPSEEELSASLRKGMSFDEVAKVFGSPYLSFGGPGPKATRLSYEIAPERRNESPDGKVVENGFDVLLRDGKVTGWAHRFSNFPRELKRVGGEAPLLRMTVPELKGPMEEVDLVEYFEKVDVEDPRQEVNGRDLAELLALCSMLDSWSEQREPEERLVSADCDVMETMAIHFPEVAALRKEAKDGRIRVSALSEALEPYNTGRKPLPQTDPKGE
jgi:hypothetical protein